MQLIYEPVMETYVVLGKAFNNWIDPMDTKKAILVNAYLCYIYENDADKDTFHEVVDVDVP